MPPPVGVGELDSGADEPDADLPVTPASIEVRCGDGRVTGGENCDIAIPAGTPGACPTECSELARCNPRALNNSGCQAECVVLQLFCTSGDDCCPGNCTRENDADCSASCGDGVIQEELGETCEPGSTNPCKDSDAECDDNDTCTADKLIGGAKNCNALCASTKIIDAKAGDGCCPSGSDANTDRDCMAVCGNKVREDGEECDGTTGCSAACKLSLQADQRRCLDDLAADSDECARCSCMSCAASYLACQGSGDEDSNAKCMAVLECARKHDCYGRACYCGSSFLCNQPNGACIAEIETAGGTQDPNQLEQRAIALNNPLGYAYAADSCRFQQCATLCR